MSGIIGSAGSKSGIIGLPVDPQKPSFLATIDEIASLAVDVSTYFTGTEVFDVGGNLACNATGTIFETHGMIFTAPVTGKYQMNVWCQLSNFNANMQYVRVNMRMAGSFYYTIHSVRTGGASPASKYGTVSLSILDHMDSGDTCTLYIHQATGTSQLNVFGNQSAFSGYFVG